MTEPLPTSVIAFLRAHVDDPMKLRMLLALHHAASRTSTVGVVARLLDIPTAQVRHIASELVADGLVRVAADRVELDPASISDRLAISDLAGYYERDRDAVDQVLAALSRPS